MGLGRGKGKGLSLEKGWQWLLGNPLPSAPWVHLAWLLPPFGARLEVRIQVGAGHLGGIGLAPPLSMDWTLVWPPSVEQDRKEQFLEGACVRAEHVGDCVCVCVYLWFVCKRVCRGKREDHMSIFLEEQMSP